jgi:small neutral amino acid transporter SnatA (MarC family)
VGSPVNPSVSEPYLYILLKKCEVNVKTFWLCFVPLFVAVDSIGVLPMFIGLTQDIDARRIQRIIYQSVITATVVALIFLWAGIAILNLLGITVADFLVAGGILLFVISVSDLLTTDKIQRREYILNKLENLQDVTGEGT